MISGRRVARGDTSVQYNQEQDNLLSLCSQTLHLSLGPELPPNLWNAIIDHLWNDDKTLKVCALTCRGWLPVARYHLFHRVSLEEWDDWAKFDRILAAPNEFSCTTLGNVSPYVHEFRAYYLPSEVYVPPDVIWEISTRIIQKLQSVQSLTLGRLGDVSFYYAFSPSVRRLALKIPEFPQAADLIKLLYTYPNLSVLECDDPKIEQDIHDDDYAVVRPLVPLGHRFIISELRLENLNKKLFELLVGRLLEIPFMLLVHTLHLTVAEKSDPGYRKDVLVNKIGCHLRTLHIHPPRFLRLQCVGWVVRMPDLIANNGLVSVQFHGIGQDYGLVDRMNNGDWLCTALKNLEAPSLRELVFTSEVVHGWNWQGIAYECYDWDSIDETLVSLLDRHQGLTIEFRLVVRGSETEPDDTYLHLQQYMLRHISQSLTRLQARGQLISFRCAFLPFHDKKATWDNQPKTQYWFFAQ